MVMNSNQTQFRGSGAYQSWTLDLDFPAHISPRSILFSVVILSRLDVTGNLTLTLAYLGIQAR